mgnify:CR=1 FL=1
MSLAWISLLIAGLFEIGWPVGLKNGWSNGGINPLWIAFGVACMAASGALLFYAQRTIPMGTAYAVWTGIGAAGTFIVGVWLFGDAASLLRILSVMLIVAGVVGLKLA